MGRLRVFTHRQPAGRGQVVIRAGGGGGTWPPLRAGLDAGEVTVVTRGRSRRSPPFGRRGVLGIEASILREKDPVMDSLPAGEPVLGGTSVCFCGVNPIAVLPRGRRDRTLGRCGVPGGTRGPSLRQVVGVSLNPLRCGRR